jgi:hypothetical protein
MACICIFQVLCALALLVDIPRIGRKAKGESVNHEDRYKELEEKEKAIQADIKAVLQDYADTHCPYKVGDTVTIKGYAHRGKKGVVRKAIGTAASWRSCDFMGWMVVGSVLKADGSEGSNQFEFSDGDDEPLP